MRHPSFLGGFEIFFDDFVYYFSFRKTHVAGFFVCDASSHVPTQSQQIFSYGSYFFVLPFNDPYDAFRVRGQEADAKKFETSRVNGVS